ncbi:MAG: 4'-phosphopantetheinyl transferase superfamily protein [Thiobacillaceae bacterium]
MEPTLPCNPDLLTLLDSEVHVWFAEPGTLTDADRLLYYQSLLAPEEKERNKRFQFAKDREQFLVTHALVRLALSRYARVHPSDWCFSANKHGRPEIEAPIAMRGLRFNITHTDGLCAVVVTLKRDCGIDAEQIACGRNLEKIANRMFAVPELEAMGELTSAGSGEKFFRFWTLREAYCKALGVGLAGSTKDFYFKLVDGKQPQIIFAHDPGKADQWQFALMRRTDSHLVAVAVHRPDRPDLKIVTQALEA